MEGVITQASGVQISNKSDCTNKSDGLWNETERAWCCSQVKLFFFSVLPCCVEVVKESLERPTDLQAGEESHVSGHSHINIRVKRTSEITLMVTCGRWMGQ